MNQEVHQEIEALRTQKTKALKARYRELFGEESRSSNQAHLFRRIAWRLQAISEGDLSQRARDRAAELAADADLRLRPPRKFWRALADADTQERSRRPGRDPRLPEPGATLQRQYRGKTVCVRVLKNGLRIRWQTVRLVEFDRFLGDRNTLERVYLFRFEQRGQA
jgi:hypothetical protein